MSHGKNPCKTRVDFYCSENTHCDTGKTRVLHRVKYRKKGGHATRVLHGVKTRIKHRVKHGKNTYPCYLGRHHLPKIRQKQCAKHIHVLVCMS